MKLIAVLVLFIKIFDTVIGENSTNFLCSNGNSIEVVEICDGIDNCEDNSDENTNICKLFTCSDSEFRCLYGACIDLDLRCNGDNNCFDNSDETHCNEFINCPPTDFLCNSGECIDKLKLNDDVNDCADASDELQINNNLQICRNSTFQCIYGNCINDYKICDGIKDCVDGSDENPLVCNETEDKVENGTNKEIFCPPIESMRVSASCFDIDDAIVDCYEPVPVGTIAKLECNPFFIPVSHNYNHGSICQPDGRWNYEMKCIPECGKKQADAALPLIVNGWDTAGDLWPWHAVLYVRENDEYIFSCGGSLISESLVLTAAHCIWGVSVNTLFVALGKYHSDYALDDTADINEVIRIIVQPHYQDLTGNYGSDIAVIVLEEPVELSLTIRPVCLDWNTREAERHLKRKSIGSIVGMGITEADSFSTTLRQINLEVQSFQTCRKNQKKDFKKYITYTSFCAGLRNNSGVCNGDSGGGLVFPGRRDKSRWFIQGIVSISARKRGTSYCDPRHYTIFTKVEAYIPWLKEIIYDESTDSVIEIITN